MATKEKWRRQNLRGRYEDFDPAKLLPGEIAFITSGDPNSSSGRSVYACFEAGVVKRFTTYEDFETELQNATADVQAAFTEEIRNTIDSAITATNAANAAMEAANAAAGAANAAAEAAGAYVLGDVSQKTVDFEEAEERMLPTTGETLSILFGKVTKHLSDFVSGAISTVLGTNLTASRALVSDANGKIGVSGVTAEELECLAGTTSKVQDQLNGLNTNTVKAEYANIALRFKDYYTIEKLISGEFKGYFASLRAGQVGEANYLFASSLGITYNSNTGKHELHFYSSSGTWLCKFVEDK